MLNCLETILSRRLTCHSDMNLSGVRIPFFLNILTMVSLLRQLQKATGPAVIEFHIVPEGLKETTNCSINPDSITDMTLRSIYGKIFKLLLFQN